MARSQGRSSEETKTLVLSAAAKVIHERGLAATLEDVAAAAGVSKGGLIYHFPSKAALLRALAAATFLAFRSEVEAAIDPSDHAPGRLARAYARASIDPQLDAGAVRRSTTLIAHLILDPEIARMADADMERWRVELAADGLAPDVLAVVIAAADGVVGGCLWGGGFRTPEQLRLLQQLISLTHAPNRWAFSEGIEFAD